MNRKSVTNSLPPNCVGFSNLIWLYVDAPFLSNPTTTMPIITEIFEFFVFMDKKHIIFVITKVPASPPKEIIKRAAPAFKLSMHSNQTVCADAPSPCRLPIAP